jgi:hypothetical protein
LFLQLKGVQLCLHVAGLDNGNFEKLTLLLSIILQTAKYTNLGYALSNKMRGVLTHTGLTRLLMIHDDNVSTLEPNGILLRLFWQPLKPL